MDKRYEKKEKSIQDAFKTLLSDKYFETINVQELTRLARIDRKTFYLHYKSMGNLLKAVQDELSKEFSEKVANLDPVDDLEEVTKAFFYFSESKGKYYENITRNSEYAYVRNQMIKKVVSIAIGEKIFLTTEKSFQIAFAVNTTLLFYSEWVKSGKTMELDDIISLTTKTIKYGISK